MRGLRTICFIPSSPLQLICSPRLHAVWSVNAKTQAAAGCFWIAPTPARDDGAAWPTAATEIRPGNTTGARPVDRAVAIGLERDRVVRVPATAALCSSSPYRGRCKGQGDDICDAPSRCLRKLESRVKEIPRIHGSWRGRCEDGPCGCQYCWASENVAGDRRTRVGRLLLRRRRSDQEQAALLSLLVDHEVAGDGTTIRKKHSGSCAGRVTTHAVGADYHLTISSLVSIDNQKGSAPEQIVQDRGNLVM